MPKPKPARSTTARRSKNPEYIIRIYVAGQTAKSRHVARNLKAICDEGFPGRYKIEIVDISKHPKLAIEHNVVAVPTIIRALPAPIRVFVGSLTDENGSPLRVDLTSNQKA
jgi:circadian clock protein KaiB